jgi:hypothetical protein
VRHELHLARYGFAALAVISAVATIVGALVGGTAGALSALIGVGLIAANHAVAVASTSWARTITANVMAVGFAMFVVRMLLVLGVFGTLKTVPWVHGTVLAAAFCAALIAQLAAECVSYARGSYVPSWRVTR